MKRILSLTAILFLASGYLLSQPVNDNPCTATAVTVGTSCNFTQYTTAGATTTNPAGIPAPGCASYQGNDVWFTALVPASGNLTLDALQGNITDGAFAVYNASSCAGPFSLVGCDDDASNNGLMPFLSLQGLVPGSTVYIRFWAYNNNQSGTFSICVYDNTAPPPPPSNACLSPVPDDCSVACDFGSLPTPPPCTTGQSVSSGNTATFNLSNVGATAGNPYSQVGSCASPSSDVWYRFTATGTQLLLAITSDPNDPLVTPNVSLYNGNNCNALLPLTCFQGSGGSLSQQTYAPITPGSVYYLQISGGNPQDVGNFTLTIKNNYDCDNCLLADNMQINPAPVNGTYPPNTTVNFCFTVSNYNQTAANWLHGVALSFGSGWDLTTLAPVTIPPSCATTTGAFWGFYQSVTGSNSGVTYGPGFFYETSSGNSNGVVDNNPGNNFGDVGVGTACPVTFCWRITTKPAGSCVNGNSLNVGVNTLGDYESGSWSSTGCQNDPIANFTSTLSCCNPPAMASTATTCGLPNGTASALGDAFGPWNYSWSDATGTIVHTATAVNGGDTLLNLAAGQYFVTVTDVSGCTSTGNVVVASSAGGAATATNTGPYCTGSTISLGVTPAGVSYTWSGPNAFSSTIQNPTIANATTGMSGAYNVTITYAGGCTATATTSVTVNGSLTATINPASASICNGGSTTLTASGGTTYAWSNSGNTAAITVSPTSTTVYTVTVSSGPGCSASTSATVNVNSNPTAVINPASASVCPGNSTTLTASGGTGYSWSTTETTAAITVSPASATTYTVTVTDANTCTGTASANVSVNAAPVASITPATSTICAGASSTLTAGGGASYVWSTTETTAAITVTPANTTSYTVTATDANTCTATASATVNVNALPTPSISPASSTVCNGTSVTLTATGGTTYFWSTSQVGASITVTPATTTTYSLTATNASGCTATASAVVNVTQPFTLSTTYSDASCVGVSNGTIDLTVNGGTPAFVYLWNDGDPNEDRTGLAAGTYSVTVTDNSACSGTTSVTVGVGTGLTVTETHVDALCNGSADGTIDITATGGVSPYSYTWNDGPITEDRTGLAMGTYSVTVSDINTCSGSISVNINEPTALAVSETHVNANCNGAANGSIDVTTAGATAPYSYLWNDGPITEDRSGLLAGTYTVSITDAHGCSATLTITITEPAGMVLSETHVDELCNGASTGSIDITVNGGTNPYTDLWNDGVTTEDRSGLAAGTYTITVTDANTCSKSISVTIAQPTAVQLSETHINVSCNTGSDGSIDLTTTGGTGAYTWLWNDGDTNEDRTGLAAATYSLVATDANACTATISVTITEPAALTISQAHTDVSCNGFADATIVVGMVGGSSPYIYVWDDGSGGAVRNGLAPGTYAVTATDNNGCTAATSVDITEPAALSVASTFTNPTCPTNGNDGNIVLTTTGGTNPYHFEWDNGSTLSAQMNLGPGNYSVTVTDAHGCSVNNNFVLSWQYDFSVDATPPVTINYGEVATLGYTLTGSAGNYSAVWSPAASLNCSDCVAPEASPVFTTVFNITISNDLGCIAFDTVRVTVIPNYNIYVPNAFTPNGDGFNDVFQIFGNLKAIEVFNVQIFNRIGEKVFESNDYNFNWDGTYKGVAQIPQVFVYQMKMTFVDGHREELRKGTFTLLK